MPQHPGAGGWKSTPMRWRSDSSAVIFMMRLVMTVSVEQGVAVELRERRVGAGVAFEKFAEQKSLAA